MKKSEFMKKLKSMGKLTAEQRNKVTCSLLGHSLIESLCIGYHYCGRCGVQVGDTLGGIYGNADKCVVIGHNCPKCRANYKKLGWEHKVYTPNPFSKSK